MSEKLGFYKGKIYSDYPEEIKKLKSNGNYDKAIELLVNLIEVIEKESHETGYGVAPWYYEQLAIIYKKKKDYLNEIKVLERFAKQKHAPGVKPKKLLEKLEKLKSNHVRN